MRTADTSPGMPAGFNFFSRVRSYLSFKFEINLFTFWNETLIILQKTLK